jgi:hypothetical protein
MMKNSPPYFSQWVDWSAVRWAAFCSGLTFLLFTTLVVPHFMGGNGWVMMRLFGSIILGPEVLAPPATFHALSFVVGLMIHFLLSLVFTSVLAIVTHRWGLITGIILGILFGWALYLINIYTLTLFFPWFMVMKHPIFLIAHLLFGAVAGGVYEMLDEDPEGVI